MVSDFYLKSRISEKEGERSHVCKFTLQMGAMARAKPMKILEQEYSFRFPKLAQVPKDLSDPMLLSQYKCRKVGLKWSIQVTKWTHMGKSAHHTTVQFTDTDKFKRKRGFWLVLGSRA